MVLLATPATFEGDPVEVPPWTELAFEDNNRQATPEELEDGDTLAMETRDDLRWDWPGERVFALVDGDTVYLFHEDGRGCESSHPEDGAVQVAQHFSEQWKAGFYRIPQPDASESDGKPAASPSAAVLSDDEDMTVAQLIAKVKREGHASPSPSPSLSPSPLPSPSPSPSPKRSTSPKPEPESEQKPEAASAPAPAYTLPPEGSVISVEGGEACLAFKIHMNEKKPQGSLCCVVYPNLEWESWKVKDALPWEIIDAPDDMPAAGIIALDFRSGYMQPEGFFLRQAR